MQCIQQYYIITVMTKSDPKFKQQGFEEFVFTVSKIHSNLIFAKMTPFPESFSNFIHSQTSDRATGERIIKTFNYFGWK